MFRWLMAVALVLGVCAPAPPAALATGEDGVAFIDADEVRRLERTPPRPMLVDVRSRAEYEQAHVLGAVSIPLAELERRVDAIPRERLVVLY
jgi:hypothetical protein